MSFLLCRLSLFVHTLHALMYFLFTYLFIIYLFTYLFIYLLIYLFIYLFIYLIKTISQNFPLSNLSENQLQ